MFQKKHSTFLIPHVSATTANDATRFSSRRLISLIVLEKKTGSVRLSLERNNEIVSKLEITPEVSFQWLLLIHQCCRTRSGEQHARAQASRKTRRKRKHWSRQILWTRNNLQNLHLTTIHLLQDLQRTEYALVDSLRRNVRDLMILRVKNPSSRETRTKTAKLSGMLQKKTHQRRQKMRQTCHPYQIPKM